VELPVPLIYLDEKRSFGGALDDAQRRLAHYREVIERSEARFGARRRAQRSIGSSCA
jgi:dolichol-phosphate mannosyltransferase